jgi:hypothetical protein
LCWEETLWSIRERRGGVTSLSAAGWARNEVRKREIADARDEVTRSFGIKRLVTLESIQSRGKTISCSIRFSKSKRTFSNVTESIGISNRKVNILGGGT